ncbi:hypothetical protein [Nocardia fluminea]|uniref:hypothetical protein n=1 Tax=Nocardia fluminea TaxID=134984 RepID=UPI0033DCC90F
MTPTDCGSSQRDCPAADQSTTANRPGQNIGISVEIFLKLTFQSKYLIADNDILETLGFAISATGKMSAGYIF